MPNWTENQLIISLPSSQVEALCSAIEGPMDWPFPIDAIGREVHKAELSQHEKLRIDANLDTLIAEFHKRFKASGWPDWMKPGFLDLVVFDKNPQERAHYFETVPFSIPALRPWKDVEEFHIFFSEDEPDSKLWSGTRETSPILKMRQYFMSVKWPPSSIELKLHPMGDRTQVKIRYTTPWSPIETLTSLLTPTLEAHGAKALLKWVEEQGYCGYQYMDPFSDNFDEHAFEDPDVFLVAEKDEDGDEHRYFDQEIFISKVRDRIDDPDFDDSNAVSE